MGFLTWLENSMVARWVAESLYGYPTVLSLHGIGMAFLVGILVMFNIRLLGFAKGVNVQEFSKLLKVAIYGLIANTLTGIALFSADANRFFVSIPFIVKIFFIVVGLLICWFLVKKHVPQSASWQNGVAPASVKVLSGISILAWLVAIVAGRLMAYL